MPDPAASINTQSVRDKYAQERDKRYHPDGLKQYIVDLAASPEYARYQADPWRTSSNPEPALRDGDSCTVLIVGAGFGGILFAASLVKAGMNPAQIRLVDTAMGFGGTWYWNRYPGLHCDVESYIYMPLLEDTGYVPRHKYSAGPELREHAHRIAEHFGLADKAQFGTRVDELRWDEDGRQWVAGLVLVEEQTPITVRSEFVITAYGIGHYPKLPAVPGLDGFKGSAFHTSRWDYGVTGGSEAQPDLTLLRDKRVGIVGTGATAVQAIPFLARWAKDLYVFQRTPSSVGPRNNGVTDLSRWKENVATHRGWQMDRAENFNAFLANETPRPEVDLVDDEWTKLPSYSALIGSAVDLGAGKDGVEQYVAMLEELDMPQQESRRHWVDGIVHDKTTAENLKAWYPSWCKRPCFSDDYLQAFNSSSVHLVPTGPRGIEHVSEKHVTVDGKDYELDVLIFATGFRPPTSGSPAERSRMKVYGRGGLDMDDKWASPDGLSTLHGMLSRGFPNFFFPGPNQMGAAPNGTYQRDRLGEHFAYVITAAKQRRGGAKVVIEPSDEAEKEWSARTASNAARLTAMVSCTPNYMITPEEQEAAAKGRREGLARKARGALWGRGTNEPFQIITETVTKIFLPARYAEEVKDVKELSFTRALAKELFAGYSGFEPIAAIADDANIIQTVARLNITTSLKYLTDDVSTEAAAALAEYLGQDTEWRETAVKAFTRTLAARLSARVFVGPSLCADKAWLAVSAGYAAQCHIAAFKLQSWPRPVRRAVNWFLPECRALRRMVREARRILKPIVAEREGKPRKDTISWLQSALRASNLTRYTVADFQLGLSLAAIHTTTELLTHALLDIVTAGPELISQLREEIINVFGESSPDGELFTKTRLYSMRLLDSAIKESQRLHTARLGGMGRVALQPVTLPSGLHIPAGAYTTVLLTSHSDPDLFPSPETYNPRRFLEMRSRPGQDKNWQLVTTSPHHLAFGYGAHACPGRFLAAAEVKIALVRLLMGYDWRVEGGRSGDVGLVSAHRVADPAARNLCTPRNLVPTFSASPHLIRSPQPRQLLLGQDPLGQRIVDANATTHDLQRLGGPLLADPAGDALEAGLAGPGLQHRAGPGVSAAGAEQGSGVDGMQLEAGDVRGPPDVADDVERLTEGDEAAGPEHPAELAEGAHGVRDVRAARVRVHHVEAAVRERRQVLRVGDLEREVRRAVGRSHVRLLRKRHHRRRDVDADRVPVLADRRQVARYAAGPGPDVQHCMVGAEVGQEVGCVDVCAAGV
ncbi:hypothetical protein PpBr36_04270, partial [Pyricularia pennisetigena]|uniref:hypothetical protein n=1 Tax=Pyricularia pennisetigena TaxID=1578925 RepID=UPI00114FFA21